jgi:hypothetical protein
MPEPEEKRRHPYHRKFVRHKVRLKVEVQTQKSYQSWTNNLSEDGVCFEIPRRVEVGEEVGVWIYVSRSRKDDHVRTRAQVVWTEKGHKGHRHGGHFVWFREGDQERLRSFLAVMKNPTLPPPP